jgi:AcrR family transcriptional regulator
MTDRLSVRANSTDVGSEKARPGRQRSQAADDSILAATLDVLAADGYGGLTMSAVIVAAGVSSATLYRRWPTKQQLVAAALASLHSAVVDIDTGSLEGDIAEFLRSSADTMSIRRVDLAEDVAVELRRNPDFRAAVNEKFVVPRLVVLGHILDRACNRGELGPGLSAEVAMSFINGPLHHRVFVMGGEPTPAFLRSVVAAALASLHTLAPVHS